MVTDLDGCKIHSGFVSVVSLEIPNLLKENKPNFAPERDILFTFVASKILNDIQWVLHTFSLNKSIKI